MREEHNNMDRTMGIIAIANTGSCEPALDKFQRQLVVAAAIASRQSMSCQQHSSGCP